MKSQPQQESPSAVDNEPSGLTPQRARMQTNHQGGESDAKTNKSSTSSRIIEETPKKSRSTRFKDVSYLLGQVNEVQSKSP